MYDKTFLQISAKIPSVCSKVFKIFYMDFVFISYGNIHIFHIKDF